MGDDETVRGIEGVQALGDSLSKSSSAMKDNYDKIVKTGLSSIVDASNVSHDVTIVDGVASATESVVEIDNTDYGLTPELNDANYTSNFSAITAAGADWVSLAVDHVTESKISITNSSGPSGLASMINGMVSTMRGVDFNLAGGNIGDNAIANSIEGIVNTGKAAVSGLVGSPMINSSAILLLKLTAFEYRLSGTNILVNALHVCPEFSITSSTP